MWNVREWKATGCNLLEGVVTESTAASAKLEALVSTVIGMSGIKWVRTGAEVKAFFRALKAE